MEEWDVIEKIVSDAPTRSKTTFDELLSFIIASKQYSDLIRSKFCYSWILHYVKPDPVKTPNEKTFEEEIKRIFNTGNATPHGYAVLYHLLCEKLSIPSQIVTGWSKLGGNYDPEKNPEGVPHEWNLIEINGEFCLVDLYQAAVEQIHETQINTFYYNPGPYKFIKTHFPENPNHELIFPFITKEEYMKFPKYKALFYHNGLKNTIPDISLHENINENTYKFIIVHDPKKSKQNIMQGVLEKNIAGKLEEIPNSVLIQRKSKYELEINVRFKGEGSYNLTMYAKKTSPENKFVDIVTYRLKCMKKDENIERFPEQLLKFTELYGNLISPLISPLIVGNVEEFEVKCENVEKIVIAMGDNMYALKNEGNNIFKGKFEILSGIDDVEIAAKEKGHKDFAVILSYQVKDKKKLEEEKNIQKAESTKSVKKEVAALNECGIINYPNEGILKTTKNHLEIQFDANPECAFGTTLINEKQDEIENSMFVQHLGSHFHMHIQFPDNGKYTLTIFANRDGGESLSQILEYIIEVSESQKLIPSFPEVFADFRKMEAFLYEPFSGVLKSGGEQSFRIKIMKVDSASVFLGPLEIPLDKGEGNTFYSVKPLQLPKSGTVTVCGGLPDGTMKALLRYKIEK